MSVKGAIAAGALVFLGIAGSVGLAVWAWDVRRPGPDGVLGTGDDVMRANELRLPVGCVVAEPVSQNS